VDGRDFFDILPWKTVLPVGDLSIRKAIQKIYSIAELLIPAIMLAIAHPRKPYGA
jgi:3-methyladenine DNA glycosylase/8-oxoguanine DNA glycosylase